MLGILKQSWSALLRWKSLVVSTSCKNKKKYLYSVLDKFAITCHPTKASVLHHLTIAVQKYLANINKAPESVFYSSTFIVGAASKFRIRLQPNKKVGSDSAVLVNTLLKALNFLLESWRVGILEFVLIFAASEVLHHPASFLGILLIVINVWLGVLISWFIWLGEFVNLFNQISNLDC